MTLSNRIFLTLVGLALLLPLVAAFTLFGILCAIKCCAEFLIMTWDTHKETK